MNGTATITFEAIRNSKWTYTFKHTRNDAQKLIDQRNELLYAHGDQIEFVTTSGAFRVRWQHHEGKFVLRSPLENGQTELSSKTGSGSFRIGAKVDTPLTKTERLALRDIQAAQSGVPFIAKYRYLITVDTLDGNELSDERVGTYDC